MPTLQEIANTPLPGQKQKQLVSIDYRRTRTPLNKGMTKKQRRRAKNRRRQNEQKRVKMLNQLIMVDNMLSELEVLHNEPSSSDEEQEVVFQVAGDTDLGTEELEGEVAALSVSEDAKPSDSPSKKPRAYQKYKKKSKLRDSMSKYTMMRKTIKAMDMMKTMKAIDEKSSRPSTPVAADRASPQLGPAEGNSAKPRSLKGKKAPAYMNTIVSLDNMLKDLQELDDISDPDYDEEFDFKMHGVEPAESADSLGVPATAAQKPASPNRKKKMTRVLSSKRKKKNKKVATLRNNTIKVLGNMLSDLRSLDYFDMDQDMGDLNSDDLDEDLDLAMDPSMLNPDLADEDIKELSPGAIDVLGKVIGLPGMDKALSNGNTAILQGLS